MCLFTFCKAHHVKPVELVSEARWRQSELHRFPKPDDHFVFDNDDTDDGDDDEEEGSCVMKPGLGLL